LGRKTTIKFQGQDRPGEELEFETASEDWNVYQLEDGTELRVRLVAGKVVRLDDAYNAEGDPIYIFQSSNAVSTSVPSKLRRPQQ